MANRLIKFLRSVLPADPYQLLFLVGIVFLLIAHGLKWQLPVAHMIRLPDPSGPYPYEFGVIAHLLIIFAAMAGYFICFWPGSHPVRRISVFVISPAALGLILTLGRYLFTSGPTSTILRSSVGNASAKISWILTIFWQSPGATVTFFGLLLIILFAARLAFGISTLPLSLSDIRPEATQDLNDWTRIQRLVWFLVALTPLPLAVLVLIALPEFLRWGRSSVFSDVATNFGAAVLYVIAVLLVGAEGRTTIGKYLTKPGLKWVAFALLLPIAVEALLYFGQVGLDHLQHTMRDADFVPFDEFRIPTLVISLLVFVVPAFVEESIFRGLLQARFIIRYGLFRGILLVNIAWAAFHFYTDFSFTHKSYFEAADQLCVRIFITLTFGFVLSWLTLRSHSIVPATLAHALYNTLNGLSSRQGLMTGSYVRFALWGLVACILFQCWPATEQSKPEMLFAPVRES